MNIDRSVHQPRSKTPSLRIGFILARQFTLSTFALFVDTLRLAADHEDRSNRIHCDWSVMSSSRGFCTSSCGIQVAATSSLVDPRNFDYIVVVGGLLSADNPLDSATMAYLAKAAELDVALIGLCTGSFILAEANLLDGHAACVSWLHHKEFCRRFPDIKATSEQIFHLDRKRATCAGGSAAADLAAVIVRKHVGAQAERNAMEILQIARWRRPTEAQPRRPLGIQSRDRRVQRALLLMEQHIEDLIPINTVAELVGLSRRQLERLFEKSLGATPGDIYLRIRLEVAKRLIVEEPRRPLIDVALETGFSGTGRMAGRFRSLFGQTPAEIRKQLKAEAAL